MNKSQEQKKSALDTHVYLNDIDSELEEISLDISLESAKQESFNICKICSYDKVSNVSESLCDSCKEINKENKIGRVSFITGSAIGSIVSGVALGFSGTICVAFGLSLGVIVQNLYRIF
jgi:hypothetical protein